MEGSTATKLPFGISGEIVVQWGLMVFIIILSIVLTHNLKKNPNKKQAALEKIYVTIESLVASTMGENFINFVPYVGTLIVFLLAMNFTGLIGIAPPTQSLGVTIGLTVISIVTIHFTSIKRNGLIGYLKGYVTPNVLMLPITLMERVTFPISLALRLFGNMYAATLLVDLVYSALSKVASFAQIGIPIFVHSYFDVFDGAIQMVVFCMLTMMQIKLTAEE